MGEVQDPRHGVEYLFRKLLIPALRESYNDLLDASQNADLLVSYPLTLAMPLVADVLAKKWVSVHPWPMSIWSAHDFSYHSLTPLLPSLHRLPPVINTMMGRTLRPVFHHWMKDVRTLRRELGLPPAENPMFKGQYSPYAALALFSPHFVAPQPDWPAHSIACGYCFYDQRGVMGCDARHSDMKINSELHHYLESGASPLVFTLGSAAVYTAHDFYEQSIRAAQKLGQRALLLIGDERNRPPSLPVNNNQFAAFCYAPYSEVFRSARAIIHHGGGGTIGQVLRAGKPSLTVPFGLDQPDHAMRLYRSGAGRFLARKRYTAQRAALEISALLETPSYAQRALEIGALVQAENGAATAADAIERVLIRPENLGHEILF